MARLIVEIFKGRPFRLIAIFPAIIIIAIGCARFQANPEPQASIRPEIPVQSVPTPSDKNLIFIPAIIDSTTLQSGVPQAASTVQEVTTTAGTESLIPSEQPTAVASDDSGEVPLAEDGAATPRSPLRLRDLLNQPITVTIVEQGPGTRIPLLPPLPRPLSPSIELPDVPVTVFTENSPETEANSLVEAETASNADLPPIRVERTVQVPILMYHYLSIPPADADIYRLDLSVRPDQFASHLDEMRSAGYTTIGLYELWDNLVNGTELPPQPVILTFDDGYQDNYDNAFPLLRERGMTATFFVVTDFIDQARVGYVSWDMVREMHNAGMSIESHGINHFSLKNQDVEFLTFQALRTKEIIEAQIGVVPRFVSYPAGEYDQQTIAVFESAGYLAGVTTIQGALHSSTDLFELRRVRVRGTTDSNELLRLLALDW